jgi:hypothetical protein
MDRASIREKILTGMSKIHEKTQDTFNQYSDSYQKNNNLKASAIPIGVKPSSMQKVVVRKPTMNT